MHKKITIPVVIVALLIISFLVFFLINSNRHNDAQWKNTPAIPASWSLVSEIEGGVDFIDSPQKTITKNYKTPGDLTTALQELRSSLTAANYTNITIDIAGCDSLNPTPTCYVSGDNEAHSLKASKSVEDTNSLIVVITKQ